MNNLVVNIITHKDDPAGLKTVSIGGRSIKAFVIPRVDLGDITNFENIDKPGVYFLLNDNSEDQSVYIGQAKNVLRRLIQQRIGKENWTTALAFTAVKEMNPPFLEKLCIDEVELADRYKTNNRTGSPGNQVSNGEEILNIQFMEDIKFLTKLLGYKIFGAKPIPNSANKYTLRSKGVGAVGAIMEGNEFIIYEGSEAVLKTVPSFDIHVKSSARLRDKLKDEGIIQLSGIKDRYVFSRDYIFSSPSAAADIVRGMATNGWIAWIGENGKTLDENIRKVSK